MADIHEIKKAVCTYYKISDEGWLRDREKPQVECRLPRQVFVLTCSQHGHSDYAISAHLKRDRAATRDLRRRADIRDRKSVV